MDACQKKTMKLAKRQKLAFTVQEEKKKTFRKGCEVEALYSL